MTEYQGAPPAPPGRTCQARDCKRPALCETGSRILLCAGCIDARLKYAERNVPAWIKKPAAFRRELVKRLNEWDYLYAG